jgi:hypothetical protein
MITLENYTDQVINECIIETSKILSIPKESVLNELEYIYPGIKKYIIKSPSKKSPYFPPEIINGIALNSDIDALAKLCKTDRKMLKKCNTKSFWINKFAHDNLPILNDLCITTIGGWVKEYKRVLNAINKSKRELPSAKYYPFYRFEPYIHFSILHQVFPSLWDIYKEYPGPKYSHVVRYNDYFKLKGRHYQDEISIPLGEFKEGLVKLYYNYPKYSIIEDNISQ